MFTYHNSLDSDSSRYRSTVFNKAFLFHTSCFQFDGGVDSKKGCFGRTTKFFRESQEFCPESGDLENFPANMK